MALPVGRVTCLSPDATTVCTAWVAQSGNPERYWYGVGRSFIKPVFSADSSARGTRLWN